MKKIQTCLCKNKDGDLECHENSFATKFYSQADNGKIYSTKKNDCDVTLFAKDAESSGVIVEQQPENNKVLLKDAKPGVDIEYEVEPTRIKENIIIKERQDNYVYDFDINLTNLNIAISEDSKSLELKNKETGEIEFKIPGPFMYDANGEYSDLVSYEIQEDNGILAIKVIAEPDYFNDANRAFPVVIDPQVMTNDDQITNHSVYYRSINTSSSGSGTSSKILSFGALQRPSTNRVASKSPLGLSNNCWVIA